MGSVQVRPTAMAVWLLMSVASLALAQDNKEIVTDRPDITESGIVVPKGSLQFENGLTWTLDHGQKTFDLSETLIRFGIAKRTELRVGAPDFLDNLAGRNGSSGFADVSIGMKQQLGPLPGKIELAVIAAVSLPSGGKSITSDGFDPFIKLPWSREFEDGWSIGGMQSFFWNTVSGRRIPVVEPTVYLERQLTRPWDAFIEYGGDYPQDGSASRQVIHLGTAYKIKPTHQVDFHFGFGLNHATPNHFFAIGYSFRIDGLLGRH